MSSNSTVIAGWKIDKVTNILCKPYDEKVQKLTKEMNQWVYKACLPIIPDDILKFAEKYPKLIQMSNSFYFYFGTGRDKRNFYLSPNVPGKVDFDTVITEGSEIKSILNELAKEIIQTENERNKMANQINCSLSKLHTYKKIEANFPEAYEILLYEVDNVNKPSPDNLCDNIEELRAKLNKKN